jgi:hypothetical protein
MGGGADYIKPAVGHSLDANKVYEGKRTLAQGALVPPQLRGRKNVSTEDVALVVPNPFIRKCFQSHAAL